MKKNEEKLDERLNKFVGELEESRKGLFKNNDDVNSELFLGCFQLIIIPIIIIFSMIGIEDKSMYFFILTAWIVSFILLSFLSSDTIKNDRYNSLKEKYYQVLLKNHLAKSHPKVKPTYSTRLGFKGSTFDSIYSKLKTKNRECYSLKYRNTFIGISETSFHRFGFTNFYGTIIKIDFRDKNYPKTEIRTNGKFANVEKAKIRRDEFQAIEHTSLYYKTEDEFSFDDKVLPIANIIEELSNKFQGIRVFLEGTEIVILIDKTPFTLDEANLNIRDKFEIGFIEVKIARKINTILSIVDAIYNANDKIYTEKGLVLKAFEPIELDRTKM